MKSSFAFILIGLSLFTITACADKETVVTPSSPASEIERQEPVLILEKPSSIKNLFENFNKEFSSSSIQQNTAFKWQSEEKSLLLNGFRIRLDDTALNAQNIEDFFLKETFIINTANSDQTDKSWKQGYEKKNIVCMIQGQNGNIERNTRDINVNCADIDEVI